MSSQVGNIVTSNQIALASPPSSTAAVTEAQIWNRVDTLLKTSLRPNDYDQIQNYTSVQDDRSGYNSGETFSSAAAKLLANDRHVRIYESRNQWSNLGQLETCSRELSLRTEETVLKVVQILDEFTKALPRYQEYYQLFPYAPRLKENVILTCERIVRLNCRLIEHLRKNPIKRLFRSIAATFESTFNDSIEDIKALSSTIEAEAHAAFYAYNQAALETLLNMNTQNQILPGPVKLPCHYLPFAVNARFTGRQDILVQLRRTLCNVHGDSIAFATVTGLGGVGKTEIALQFAYDNISYFQIILWISAERSDRMLQNYVDIARRLGIEPDHSRTDPRHCMIKVLSCLSVVSFPWLIIYDNATDIVFQEFKGAWPSGKSGSVLLTTRTTEFSLRLSPTTALTIEPFSAMEGEKFVRSLLQPHDNTEKELIDDDDSLRNILRALDNLPLALSQAAAFMKSSRCTCTEYLKLLNVPSNAQRLYARPAMGSTSFYEHTISTVWNIQIQNLSSEARDLLETLCFLDPDDIPEEFFVNVDRNGTAKYSSSTSDFRIVFEELAANCLVKSSKRDAGVRASTTPFRDNSSIVIKNTVYLSVQQSDNSTVGSDMKQSELQKITLHRLVQEQTLSSTSTARRQQAFENVQQLLLDFCAVAGVVGEADLDCNWDIYESIMPHISSIQSKYKKKMTELELPQRLHQILAYALIFLHGRGSFNSAIAIFPTIEQLCKAEKDPFQLAKVYDVQGDIYRNSNDAAKAHELYSEALEVLVQEPKSDERDRLLARAYSTLGNSSLGLGQVQNSLNYHQQGLSIQKELAERKRDPIFGNAFALALLNSGWAYWKNGEFDKGSEVLEEALAIIDRLNKTPNKVWARRSWALRCLGNIRLAQGRHSEAFAMHNEAFQIQVQHFGYEHHETGDLCYKLALHYRYLKDNEEASRYLTAALNVYKAVAGEVEVRAAVSRTRYMLHLVLLALGKTEEAQDMKAEAAKVRLSCSGIEPDQDDSLEAYEALVPYWGQ